LNSVLKYLLEYRKESILAPVFKLFEACFDLLVPIVVAMMIDYGVAQGDRGRIYSSLALLVGLAVVGLAMAVTAQYYAAKAATGFASKLRRVAFSRIQRLSFAQIDRFGPDSLATRLTSDINQIQTGVNLVLRLFMRSPIIVFGATIMAFVVDAKAALVFLAALPVLAIIVFAILLVSLPLYTERQRRLDAIALAARENLVGARVIRAFNMESEETRRFEGLTSALMALERRAGALAGLMNPATYLVVNLAIVGVIASGAARVQIGAATQGETVALIGYMTQILIELIKLANLIVQTNKAFACVKRVAEIIEEPDGMTDGTFDLPIQRLSGTPAVSFQNVSFAYPGASGRSLEGITFDAAVGQTIGIIGGTGSGKTTLANLIPRFYDPSAGKVLVFGRDVREYRLKELRKATGIAPQKAELFSGTIASNLRWGSENATDEELDYALEIAQAKDFVDAKPGRLNSVVEQNGRNLSGGQRQRLTIARALVKKPSILILDDSSSALDYATNAKLGAALKETSPEDRVTFIVAQRAASVLDADLILVLDVGRLVGKGTHEELLRENRVYQEIYYSQFPKEGKGGRA
jgi:ATP-binding cassette subfamily B multidrug efflux pump